MKDFIESYYGVGDQAVIPIKLFITAISIYLVIMGTWLYLIFIGREENDDIVEFLAMGFFASIFFATFWPIILPIIIAVLAMAGLSKLFRMWGENYRALSSKVDLNKVDKTLEEMKDLVDKAEKP